MKNVLNIYKPIGLSPLDVIKILKDKNPKEILKNKDAPITYAGRLDPLAEGVLILLAGDEVHKAEEYQKLDKEYEAEILFGFETDTYDILGIPKLLRLTEAIRNMNIIIKKKIENLVGKISLPLPPYSSYKIQGKPAFMWAREGKLSEIKIPVRTTNIYNAETLDFLPAGRHGYETNSKELLRQITEKIKKVKGDFRQKEILKNWNKILNKNTKQNYLIIKVRFSVSSGTYIRSIAHSLGSVLLSLKRTKVGNFDIKDSIKL
jgi:tRNA pseudouridine(55) synthase